MLGLRCRAARLRRSVPAQRRLMSSDDKESPAQITRREMDEEERKMQLDHYSMFELLRPARPATMDWFRKLNTQFSFTQEALHKWAELKEVEARILGQRFMEERHQMLGFDLAAAHFLIARGGRVRLKGSRDWLTLQEGVVPLPGYYTHGYRVEGLDASGTEIVYEGLENFIKLHHLRSLLLRDCPFVDDWCLDRVCGEFRSLQHLDLSGCRRVSARGIEALSHLKNLRTLTLERMEHIQLLPYIGLMLEDAIPGLEIRGVNLLQPPPERLQVESSQMGIPLLTAEQPPAAGQSAEQPPAAGESVEQPPAAGQSGEQPPAAGESGEQLPADQSAQPSQDEQSRPVVSAR